MGLAELGGWKNGVTAWLRQESSLAGLGSYAWAIRVSALSGVRWLGWLGDRAGLDWAGWTAIWLDQASCLGSNAGVSALIGIRWLGWLGEIAGPVSALSGVRWLGWLEQRAGLGLVAWLEGNCCKRVEALVRV